MISKHKRLDRAHQTTIGKLIRSRIAALSLTPAQVNVMLGLPRGSPGIYMWMRGKNGVSDQYRDKLAAALNVDADRLTSQHKPPDVSIDTPIADALLAMPQQSKTRRPEPTQQTFSLRAIGNGMARITIDTTMPLHEAIAIITAIFGTAAEPPT